MFFFYLWSPHKYTMSSSITKFHQKVNRERIKNDAGRKISPAADVKLKQMAGLVCYHIDNRFAVRAGEVSARRSGNFSFVFTVIQNFSTSRLICPRATISDKKFARYLIHNNRHTDNKKLLMNCISKPCEFAPKKALVVVTMSLTCTTR